MIETVPLPGYLRRRARAVHDLLPRERWSAVIWARPLTDRALILGMSVEAQIVRRLINPYSDYIPLADVLREVTPWPWLGSAEPFVELALADRYGGLWLLVEAEASVLAIADMAGVAA
jgi:hypothetical protein